MAKKAYEESNIANIAVAIREKTKNEKTYKTSEMPSGVTEVFDKGYTSGYTEGYSEGDSDGYDKGYGIGYNEGLASAPPDYLQYVAITPKFNGYVFPDHLRDVTLRFALLTKYGDSAYHFANTNATSLTVIGENITEVIPYYMFWNNLDLKYIDLSKCGTGVTNIVGNCNHSFGDNKQLESIIGILDFSNATVISSCFNGCPALKEVRIAQQSIKLSFQISHSANLSPETIQSVIDGLADLTGQTAQTLDFHSDIIPKLTEEQFQLISSKNWSVI